MGNVVVDGATYQVIADPPVVTIPTPAIPAGVLVVNSSSDLKGKDETKPASLKTDMEGQSSVTGIGYTNGSYTIPGVLSWDGKLNGSQESAKATKNGSGVTVDDTNSGSVTWTVVTPAQQPSVPSPIPDPNTEYPGTWTLISANNTALTTVE